MTEPPAAAPDLTAGSVAGVWNASVSGQTCKVATPQTKFGAGFRAGPLALPRADRRREIVECRRQAAVAL